MIVKINKSVFNKYPDLRVGFLIITKANNFSRLKEAYHLLKEIEEFTRFTFHKENLKNHYMISPWETARFEFGKNYKHYNTSVENLIKDIKKRKTTKTKDVISTLLNYIQLKHIVPAGLDDLDKIVGNITYSVSRGTEKVDILRKIKKGALYYKDEKGILGTKLDYWKTKRTKPTDRSDNILVHFDFLPPITNKKSNEIIKEFKELVKTFCKAKVTIFTLKKSKISKIVS